jgi:hypothetical protein
MAVPSKVLVLRATEAPQWAVLSHALPQDRNGVLQGPQKQGPDAVTICHLTGANGRGYGEWAHDEEIPVAAPRRGP